MELARDDVLAAGAQAVLAKPFSADQLRAVLRAVLSDGACDLDASPSRGDDSAHGPPSEPQSRPFTVIPSGSMASDGDPRTSQPAAIR